MRNAILKSFLLIGFCEMFCLSFSLRAQENKNIDSIKQIIKKIPAGEDIRKAKELINLGQQYVFGSDYTAATDCYQQSLTIAQNISNDSLQAGCYIGLAVISYYQHDFYKDSIYHFKALEIFRKSHDTLREGKTLRNIAAGYAQRGNLPLANKYFEEASIIFKKLNQLKLEAGVYSNMAAMYRWDFRKSIELEMAAKRIWDKDPNDGVLPAANIGNLGIHYFYIVKFDSLKSIRHDSLISASASENLEKAETYLRQAIQMAQQNNDLNNKSHYIGELAELQEYKGNYKDAYFKIREYYQVQDSIFSQENKNKIAALESQRAIDLKNREIENKELQLGNQQKKMWLLVSVIAFLVTVGVLIFRQSLLRKKTNTVLLKLNNELDEANKVKAKFFGILSHDLRSPVANLINFLQLQKRKPGIMSEEQISDRENKITHSAKTLLDTMDAMLLWSKGQMEHFIPSVTNVAVDDLFDYLKRFFADTPQVLFAFSNDGNLFVQTDKNYLQAIILNLTANAVKALANTQEPAITWKAWREDNDVFLTITDNGPGAGDGQLKALYDDTVGSGKNGLGLHIIRDLAKAIGCSIQLLPQTARGTSFIIGINSRAI